MIGLRPVRPEDKEMIRTWRNLPEVARYMYTDHHITTEEHEKWFRGLSRDPSRRYWIITLDGEDVGLVNLYNITPEFKRAHWAFYLASPSVRGKGVGSFVEYSVMKHVFEEMGFNKLCCEVLGFNEAVVRMHESFGFVQEGHFREHVMKGADPMDVVAMAILRGEWQAKRPEIEERLATKGLL